MSFEIVKAPFEYEYAPTLPNLFRDAVSRFGDRDFIVCDGKRISFAQAERETAERAKALLALGVGKAGRVGLLMANEPDWVLNYLAAARAGALTVSLSTFFQAAEISWGLRFNDISVLLINARYLKNDYIERLERAIPGLADQTSTELHLASHPYLRHIVVWGDCDRAWAMKGTDALRAAAAAKPAIDDALLRAAEDNIAPADLLLTICTSGTTSEPKAVVHSHGVALRATALFKHYLRLRADDRLLAGHALFWVGGHNMFLMPALHSGCSLHFPASPNPVDIVELVEREGITVLNFWPSQIKGVLEQAAATGATLECVRRGIAGQCTDDGVPIPADRQSLSFGMTETFGMHSMEIWHVPAPPGKAGNWGRHMPGVERLVLDPETRTPVAPGKVGELYVRGVTMMTGYYKKERDEVFTREGFFPTGDLVSIDEDDYLFFHGRRTEMIKTSGANVSPREVETVLHTFPEVREALVLGIPDPVKGEAVVAVIVPADGQEPDVETIRARLRQEISPYKVPQQIRILPYADIPRTGSEKAIKRNLVDLFTAPDDTA